MFRRLIQSIMLIAIACIGILHGTAHAQDGVTVPLMLLGSSSADGTAILTPNGAGTRIMIDIGGLAPNQTAAVIVTGGSCAMPGASTVSLPMLAADAQGHATMSGDILFRGVEPIALHDIADGAHAISIGGAEGALACGDVPRLVPAASETQASSLLDANVGIGRNHLLLLMVVIALAAALAIIPRSRHNTPRQES